MSKKQIKDFLLWGFAIWFIGYILGIIFFMIVPPHLIGWIIMPIGTAITWWILAKKIHGRTMKYYFILALFWTCIAILFDYIFIIMMLHPADGYYKPAVIIYYLLTFFLPIIIGTHKNKRAKTE